MEHFIAVEVPPDAAKELAALQARIGNTARSGYGYTGKVTHGNSPFHITLISPTKVSVDILDRAIDAVAARHASFFVSLTGIKSFGAHTIYAACERGCDTLAALKDELEFELETVTQPKVFHASLLRKFKEAEFGGLMTAAQEVSDASPSLWPIVFPVHALHRYTNSGGDAGWEAGAVRRFGAERIAA